MGLVLEAHEPAVFWYFIRQLSATAISSSVGLNSLLNSGVLSEADGLRREIWLEVACCGYAR